MDYIKDNVSITSARKLLYGCVFKRFRIKTDEEHEENLILGKVKIATGLISLLYIFSLQELISALNMIMGKSLSEKQAKEFRELLGWDDADTINFKAFCGICSLCERILAAEYCPHMPAKKADPCHEVNMSLQYYLKILLFNFRSKLPILNRLIEDLTGKRLMKDW